jgi:hypothetical protein
MRPERDMVVPVTSGHRRLPLHPAFPDRDPHLVPRAVGQEGDRGSHKLGWTIASAR